MSKARAGLPPAFSMTVGTTAMRCSGRSYIAGRGRHRSHVAEHILLGAPGGAGNPSAHRAARLRAPAWLWAAHEVRLRAAWRPLRGLAAHGDRPHGGRPPPRG